MPDVGDLVEVIFTPVIIYFFDSPCCHWITERQRGTMNTLPIYPNRYTGKMCLQKVPKRFLSMRPFATAMNPENSISPIQFLVETSVL